MKIRLQLYWSTWSWARRQVHELWLQLLYSPRAFRLAALFPDNCYDNEKNAGQQETYPLIKSHTEHSDSYVGVVYAVRGQLSPRPPIKTVCEYVIKKSTSGNLPRKICYSTPKISSVTPKYLQYSPNILYIPPNILLTHCGAYAVQTLCCASCVLTHCC